MAARRSTGTGALEIRKDKQGRETYYGRFYASGRQVRKRLGRKRADGTRDGLTKAQAEKALRDVMAATEANPPTERTTHTIESAANAYIANLETVQRRKRSTIISYRGMVTKHLAPFFGALPLDKIDADRIDAYRVAKRQVLADKTIHNHTMFLCGLFNFARAKRRRWVSENPVAELEGLDTPNRNQDIRFLSIEELDALIRNVRPGPYEQSDRAIFLTAALTGMRRGELLGLRWRDVDWTNGIIRVRQSYVYGEIDSTKSADSVRTVPMNNRVGGELDRLSRLTEFAEDDDLVFGEPLTGEPQHGDALRRRYNAALKAADVRPVRFHDLRHTFGTQMASSGAPLVAIQKWMGHADIDTTMIYAAWSNDPFQGKELVERAFQGLTEGHKAPSNVTNSNQLDPRKQAA